MTWKPPLSCYRARAEDAAHMRLALKVTMALILGITAVMVVNTIVRVRREVALFEIDQTQDQRIMGRTLRDAVQGVWINEDTAHAQAIVAPLNTSEPAVRWRWLDELRDAEKTGAPPAGPEGAGHETDLATALASGKEVTLVRHDPDGDRRYTYVPMAPAGLPPAVLELSERASPPRAFIRASVVENVLSTLLIIAICSVIALTLGFWLIGRPLRLLSAKARRVGAGNFSGPLQLRQRDEIGALAAEIDLTSDRLAEAQRRVATETEARITALEQLRHADRLKTIGQLASGVAHELGTPLNVISGRASLIASDPTPTTTATGARIIIEQTERMTGIIRHLLDFSRRRGPRLVRDELQRIVADAVEILAPLAKAHGVTIAVDAREPAPAEIDPNQMLQALTNLMMNGMQAMPDGGRLTVSVGHRRARPPADHGGTEGNYAYISVSDEGEGMSDETRAHVFEPFFTTKDVGEGTGLGLSVAWGIVQEHGGWIDVTSERGAGSEFAILLRSVVP